MEHSLLRARVIGFKIRNIKSSGLAQRKSAALQTTMTMALSPVDCISSGLGSYLNTHCELMCDHHSLCCSHPESNIIAEWPQIKPDPNNSKGVHRHSPQPLGSMVKDTPRIAYTSASALTKKHKSDSDSESSCCSQYNEAHQELKSNRSLGEISLKTTLQICITGCEERLKISCGCQALCTTCK